MMYRLAALIVVLGAIGCDTGPLEVDPDPPAEIPPEPSCQADQLTDPATAIEPDRLCGYWIYMAGPASPYATDDTLRFEIRKHHNIAASSGPAYTRIDYFNGLEVDRPGQYLFANRPDGLHIVGYITPEDSVFYDTLLYPYPARVGDKGAFVRAGRDPVTDELRIGDTLEVEVLATNTMLDTPAGSFSAYHYRFLIPPPFDVAIGDYVDNYFAPGVGRIAQIVRSPSNTDHIKYRLTLDAYELAEAP